MTMPTLKKITPCLWFDAEGEEAATFYTGIFKNSRILHVARYGSAGPRPEGMVMTVHFELDGQQFIALNGGPEFSFDEAISFQVTCASQDEVDRFWAALAEAGKRPCGWVKDRACRGRSSRWLHPIRSDRRRSCRKVRSAALPTRATAAS